MAFALRFMVGMAFLCGGSVPVMAFVDPLAIPSSRGGSASRTPLPSFHYRLRGGMQTACAVGEGGGDSIPERLAAVQAKIKHAGQPNAEVQLVAVSKFQSKEAILEAYAAGQRVFGENYVQEMVSKAGELPADICWHFIGMLQSNKAKTLVAGVKNLALVETVHSIKTADALDKACETAGRKERLNVMVQVLTSGEESKSGCHPSEAVALARHIVNSCPRLSLAGVMTIGKFGDPNPEPYFQLLKECRTQIGKDLGVAEHTLGLSMGMSGDFETAIKSGSTSVRVGTSIFGQRPAPRADSSKTEAKTLDPKP